MRLHSVAHGRLAGRLVFALARLVTGREVPDIIKVRYHRPRFFGKPFFELAQAVMRGPSPWDDRGAGALRGVCVGAKPLPILREHPRGGRFGCP